MLETLRVIASVDAVERIGELTKTVPSDDGVVSSCTC
jgi:hypothetical protein